MISVWRVSLQLARDDGAPLSEDGIGRLTERLANGPVPPDVTRRDPGAVLVEMTVDARNEMAARYAAESTLREAANQVWAALGLPPFTIAFVEVVPAPRR